MNAAARHARTTAVRLVTFCAAYALARQTSPEDWPYDHRRIDRSAFFELVARHAAPHDAGKPASRPEVSGFLATLERLGVLVQRQTRTGYDLLFDFVDRNPYGWQSFIEDDCDQTVEAFEVLASSYGFDWSVPLSLGDLPMTERERGTIDTEQRHSQPRACARCRVTKPADAFRLRDVFGVRRQSYCTDCQAADAAARRPTPTARPSRPTPARPAVPLPAPTPRDEETTPVPTPEAATPPPAPVAPSAPVVPSAPTTPPDPASWSMQTTYALVRAYYRCEATPLAGRCDRSTSHVERVDPAGPWHESNARAVCTEHRSAA